MLNPKKPQYSALGRCFMAFLLCSQSSAKPADWKYQNALTASWVALGCTVNVNIHIPLLATSPNHDLEKNTKVAHCLPWFLHTSNHTHLSAENYIRKNWTVQQRSRTNQWRMFSNYSSFKCNFCCAQWKFSFVQNYVIIVMSVPGNLSGTSPGKRLHPICAGLWGAFAMSWLSMGCNLQIPGVALHCLAVLVS